MSNEVAIRVEGLGKAYRIGLKEQQHETMLGALAAWAKSPFRNFREVRNLSRFEEVKAEDRRSKIEEQGAEDRRPKIEDGPSSNSHLPSPAPGAPNSHLPTAGAAAPSPISQLPSPTSAPADIIWALKDVSFEVKHGEAVGIIGRNGAGKSTLLKILSRITEPTRGRATVYGRVGSLLEVGTGFHPDLTGRENVYLNGTILGMKKREIDTRFDEIVDFSGVEKFIDTPVKRYSSGMRVRLAFAVAAHLEPEILLVDEVLAVGDGEFQRKCLGKMGEVSCQGRTILFVSHNMQAVQELCSRAVLLTPGQMHKQGNVAEIISEYLSSSSRNGGENQSQVWSDITAAPGNDKIRIRRIDVAPSGGGDGEIIQVETAFHIDIEYWNLAPRNPLLLNLMFFTIEGAPVFETISTALTNPGSRRLPVGLFSSRCTIPAHLLNAGSFRVKLRFHTQTEVLYDREEALRFTVHDLAERDLPWYGRYVGPVRPQLVWDSVLIREGV